MAFNRDRAELIANRIAGAGSAILIVAAGIAFGWLGFLGALGAISFVFGVAMLVRIPIA